MNKKYDVSQISFEYDGPIILVCGCLKYQKSLELAIKRFQYPSCLTIGIIGDPILQDCELRENILYVNSEDTYEKLPLKLYLAYKWVNDNFPNIIGIFKTDDDIVIENLDKLHYEILNNFNIDYWGVNVDTCENHFLDKDRILNRYTDKKLNHISIPKSFYCWGAGYWLSKKSLLAISNSDLLIFDNFGLEDVLFGSVLNRLNIYPTQIKFNFKELDRSFV